MKYVPVSVKNYTDKFNRHSSFRDKSPNRRSRSNVRSVQRASRLNTVVCGIKNWNTAMFWRKKVIGVEHLECKMNFSFQFSERHAAANVEQQYRMVLTHVWWYKLIFFTYNFMNEIVSEIHKLLSIQTKMIADIFHLDKKVEAPIEVADMDVRQQWFVVHIVLVHLYESKFNNL